MRMKRSELTWQIICGRPALLPQKRVVAPTFARRLPLRNGDILKRHLVEDGAQSNRQCPMPARKNHPLLGASVMARLAE